MVYGEETTPRYEYDYNAKGQVARVRDNLLNRTTQSEYDLANRPVRVKTSEDAKHVYTGQVAYDNVYGNLSEFTEKVGENRQEFGTKFGYDDENRPTSLTYSMGAATIGQSTTTIDKLNRTTFSAVKLGSKTFTSEYHFAAGGYGTGSVTNLVASITQPGCNCGYGYDDNGNIASATLNGKWTGYTYDALGQLIQVNDHSDTRSGENGTTWKYTYDLGGNILKKERFAYADTTNPLETVTYTYGDANWRDKLTAVNGSTIRYDAIGNPLSDGTWTYTWQNGRQLQKMQKTGVTAEFVYNADGLRVQKTVNGVATKYTLHGKNVVHMTKGNDELHFFYDAQNRPAMVVYNGAAYAYVKSLQGDIVAILDENGNAVVSYGYDALGQLVQVNDRSDTRAGDNGSTWVYEYDRGGNILSKKLYPYENTSGEPLQTTCFSYGNANWKDQLTAVDGTPITYDQIGNPLSDGKWQYTWENGRQLARMQSDNVDARFVYNESGLRVQKIVNGVVTKYTLHGKNVVHMTRGSDELHFFYDAQNKPAVVVFNGTAYAYLYNQQDDVIGLLDSNGTHMVSYTYDAWGKPISKTGTLASTLGTINPFRYRGYVYDEEAGFYYASSRYYDPEISRFINADDTEYLGADGSVLSYNLFAYCMNDPVNRFDVDGNWSLPNWAKIAIGAAAIAVGVIATVATGGAAVPVLVASLKIAATSAAIGAVSGAGISAVNHRVSTGSWEGAGKAAVTGAIDGACDGFIWGGITAGASFTTVAAKGIKVKEIGKLKPSNKPGDGYSGVKYQAPKANGKYTTKSIELHSPHKSGPHDVWHWQQNTWNPYNNSITGSAKHWTIWGKPL